MGKSRANQGLFPWQDLESGELNGNFLRVASQKIIMMTCISYEAKEELVFWETLPCEINSPILLPDAKESLDTDTTDFGICVYFNDNLF